MFVPSSSARASVEASPSVQESVDDEDALLSDDDDDGVEVAGWAHKGSSVFGNDLPDYDLPETATDDPNSPVTRTSVEGALPAPMLGSIKKPSSDQCAAGPDAIHGSTSTIGQRSSVYDAYSFSRASRQSGANPRLSRTLHARSSMRSSQYKASSHSLGGRKSTVRWDKITAARKDAPQRGDVKRAKAASLMRQCVKKTFSRGGRYITPTGRRVHIERFPWLGKSLLCLPEYGCPVAMMLYLQFIVEAALLFLLMGLLSLPAAIDAISRTSRRRECRLLVRMPNQTLVADRLAGCGYTGIDVRDALPGDWYDFYLAPGVGTCMEYAGGSNYTTSQVIDFDNDPFVDLNANADHCADDWTGIVNFWGLTLNGLLFQLFLLRVRRMQKKLESKYSAHMYTASDFAVMVTGLKVVEYSERRKASRSSITKHELDLRADLARLGFEEDDVDHIEFGRDCANEMVQLRKIARLKARRQELLFQLARLHDAGRKDQRGHAHARKRLAGFERLTDELDDIELKLLPRREETLEMMRSEAHRTTGHAFIVFQTTSLRDRFLNMFNNQEASLEDSFFTGSAPLWRLLLPAWWSRWCAGGQDTGHRPPELFSADAGRRVRVSKAPEPSDIYWENLSAAPADRRNRQGITACAIGVIIVLGTTTLYATRTQQIRVNQDASLWEHEGSRMHRVVTMLIISILSVLVTVAVNLIIKVLTEWLTFKECHPNRSSYERSIFTKLMTAYFINTIMAPLFVAFMNSLPNGRTMTQAWYEIGGVVSQAALFMLFSDILVTNFMRFVHIPAWFKRQVLGRFASSQIKLNQLWAPPRFPIGVIYAETFRSLAMGLVYAPLYPPAFLFTACALCTSFYSTKFAISRWYMTPPLVDGRMMKRMRNACGALVLVMILVEVFALVELYRVQSFSHVGHGVGAIVSSLVFWLLFISFGPLLSRTRYFSSKFGDDANTVALRQSRGGSLDEVRYDEVRRTLHYDIERYECPAASMRKTTNRLVETAFRQGFQGGYIEEGAANEVSVSTASESSMADSTAADSHGASVGATVGDDVEAAAGGERVRVAVYEDQEEDDESPFFQPVRPAAPLESPDEDSLRRSFATQRASPPTVARRPSTYDDPVIYYLDGALDMLNNVMVDLGGAAVDKYVDPSLVDEVTPTGAHAAAESDDEAGAAGGRGVAAADGHPSVASAASERRQRRVARRKGGGGAVPTMPAFFDDEGSASEHGSPQLLPSEAALLSEHESAHERARADASRPAAELAPTQSEQDATSSDEAREAALAAFKGKPEVARAKAVLERAARREEAAQVVQATWRLRAERRGQGPGRGGPSSVQRNRIAAETDTEPTAEEDDEAAAGGASLDVRLSDSDSDAD